MFHIVLSKNEKYFNAAVRLVDVCRCVRVTVDLINIEELNIARVVKEESFFFLTNNPSVGVLVRDLLSRGNIVINGKYLTGERLKSVTQKRLNTAGISIPKIISTIKFESAGRSVDIATFPAYVKSETHGNGAYRVENLEDCNYLFSKFNQNLDWYIEEAVDNPKRLFQKVYWVAGCSFARDEEPMPRIDIESAMIKIGREFLFDIFSADFVVDDFDYWCVDVNPAPALYRSTNARIAFADHIRVLSGYKSLRNYSDRF